MALRREDEGAGVARIPWITMDASRSIESLHEEIQQLVKVVIEEVKHKEMNVLWKDKCVAPASEEA